MMNGCSLATSLFSFEENMDDLPITDLKTTFFERFCI